MTVAEMRKNRSELIVQTRKLLEKAEKEDRSLDPVENTQYDSLMTKVQEIGDSINKREELDRLAKEEEASLGLQAKDVVETGEKKEKVNPLSTPEYFNVFNSFIRGGLQELSPEQLQVVRNVQNALQVDIDTAGGYIVTPMQVVQSLLKNVDDMVHIRQRATVFQVPNAQALGVPTLDADPDDADWTAELGTGSEDNAMKFGGRELHPHPLAKRIKISNKLLRAAFLNTSGLVEDRLAYKFAVTGEKAYLVGTGANQPLGVFTASPNGVPTSRDVSKGNTTTAVTFDGLISAKYSLKEQYLRNAEWIFHRDVVKEIAKLKDGDGQYLWRESVRAGEPDRILNLPYMMSEFAPSTLTTGLYAGALADWRWYWIADALDMTIQRLNELYAETNQTGLIGRLEEDAMPVLAEAFTRVKLA